MTCPPQFPVKTPTIAIITATKNCASLIGTLIATLKAQTDADFTWIVADSTSTDETLRLVRESGIPDISITASPDFSIYDALNRAVSVCTADYYLVLGADDVIRPDCIENFRRIVAVDDVDFVFAAVQTFGTIRKPMRGARWLRGGNAYCASHSVGSLIRRDLHQRFGFYSNRYVNAADMHFIQKAVCSPTVRMAPGLFVAGEFSNDGVSSVDEIASLSDSFRIQLAMGESKALQFLLYVLRLARACLRPRRQAC